MEIKTATIKDVESIYLINKESLGYDFDVNQTKKALDKILKDNTQRVFVAIEDKAIVGYIHARVYDSLYLQPLVNIVSLAVLNNYQGCGAGKALIENVEEWALNNKIYCIRLESGIERTKAHQFYYHLGYYDKKDHKHLYKDL
ncbi:MAG: GNAT family N-acetyltransferase [Thomasclavelia sp.]|jgi:ribosomal protein S18 acetylase RimI-like enzyme|nr:GNAT family N-acetyltransferase [Thomasclavelia sp.]